MDSKIFVAKVMAALPELEPENKELPHIKELFEQEIERQYNEGWSIHDVIDYYRTSEHIDCWTKDETTGSWVSKDESLMIPENVAVDKMNRISAKYLKKRS